LANGGFESQPSPQHLLEALIMNVRELLAVHEMLLARGFGAGLARGTKVDHTSALLWRRPWGSLDF
jgi:hypothetical protein